MDDPLLKRKVYKHGTRWELVIPSRDTEFSFAVYKSWYQFDTWDEAIKWAVRPGFPPMFPVHNG
jgi:hypothetical protein